MLRCLSYSWNKGWWLQYLTARAVWATTWQTNKELWDGAVPWRPCCSGGTPVIDRGTERSRRTMEMGRIMEGGSGVRRQQLSGKVRGKYLNDLPMDTALLCWWILPVLSHLRAELGTGKNEVPVINIYRDYIQAWQKETNNNSNQKKVEFGKMAMAWDPLWDHVPGSTVPSMGASLGQPAVFPQQLPV